jgi:indole-3-glycerol phosphate synthase
LGRILENTAARVALLHASRERLEAGLAHVPARPSFSDALRSGNEVAVIAEVKRRSPSKGEINPEMDAVAQASAYVRGGAAAVSVLTEPENFGGSVEDLAAVSAALAVPTLRKDFVIDPLQLLEARVRGASAVLLIARALPPARLLELADVARGLALGLLVEVRDSAELETALQVRDAVIGVNNRNLETLETDMDVSRRLIPEIPRSRIAVFESGVRVVDDVELAASLGADAVLVGSSASAAPDAERAIRSLTGVARNRDARRR